jgi:hypothetical protein
MRLRDERGDAAEHCRLGYRCAAMAVARRDEGRSEIIAEQCDLGCMRAVAHAQRPAGSVAGIARRRHLARVDVGKIDRVLARHPRHAPCEARRIVEL